MLDVIKFIGGAILLLYGADLLVKGASNLAKSFGISSLVIGLTVVAFGTSAPELAVTLNASATAKPDIALGNVIGSNVFNILFILGLSALLSPLFVSRQVIKSELPVMIFAVILLFILAFNNVIDQFEGILLVLSGIIYTVFTIWKSRKEETLKHAKAENITESSSPSPRKIYILKSIFYALLGLVLLVIGSNLFVDASVNFARMFGLSELIIGLTIVSIGTSLPEVATSITATFKGEKDIAVGNVVGSNIFNIVYILGISSLINPSGLSVQSSLLYFDLPLLLFVSFVCLPLFFTGQEISRWEGVLLFLFYLLYLAYLIMQSSHYSGITFFNSTVLYFILPLSLVIIGTSFYNAVKNKQTLK